MKNKTIAALCFWVLATLTSFGQGRMILNGATVTLSNNACLVIDNPAPDALTRVSGFVVSEGENNRVKWNTGTTTGTYTVPFGFNTSYLPVTFTKTAGAGSGSLLFATYGTGWKNSDYLPTGVTNMLGQMPDHSAFSIDRFWQISPEGYSTRPALTDVTFTYLDIEHQVASNTIIESFLNAQQWNAVVGKWDEAQPGGLTNTTNNTVTVATVPANGFYKWWTLTDQQYPLPVQLLSFSAAAINKEALLTWITASEKSATHFILERSKNGVVFEEVVQVIGRGTATQSHTYTYVDTTAYTGISYYRVKTKQPNGSYTFSAVRSLNIHNKGGGFIVYPNPVPHKTFILLLHKPLLQQATLFLVNKSGQVVTSHIVPAQLQQNAIRLPLSLAAGTYTCLLQEASGITRQQQVVVH